MTKPSPAASADREGARVSESKKLICSICLKPMKPGESATRTNWEIVHVKCYGKKPTEDE